MSVIMLIATVVLAGCAVLSVFIARDSVRAMKGTTDSAERNIKLQAISQVLDEYSSVEMSGYITKLYDAFQGAKASETIDIFKNAWETKDFSKVDKDVNNARRRVAWYFAKVYSLYKAGILKKRDIKEYYLATPEIIKEILLDKVEQIEKPDRGKEVYGFFRGLYPKKNEERK